ncbi:hypothetical protein SAMN05444161_4984 [Rhizobiales bacterium GAS191]|jgi:hypothetical protein|nr:hypothetical protein SAMN05519103_04256 [Rhizobiales bacterium GAS113]SEE15184.1 hypothetical protein SAMN05444161_4984 [Rhizobiales bacterium GAS191]SEE40000.1 hypothetical protein SAMN05519104_5998 [Rhizobiales bacterium GAS188]
MTMSQAPRLSNYAHVVEELYTEAEIETLNVVLLQHGISAERIVAIIPVPAQTMVTPTPPQFRVLYRSN